MDTLRSFKRCGAKGVYSQMSCQGITNYRGTQEKDYQEWQTQKEKVEKDDSE